MDTSLRVTMSWIPHGGEAALARLCFPQTSGAAKIYSGASTASGDGDRDRDSDQ